MEHELTIKQWRAVRGISQDEMATQCGVHRNTYASWESNPQNITISNAMKIAEILKISINDIFFTSNSTKCREEEK